MARERYLDVSGMEKKSIKTENIKMPVKDTEIFLKKKKIGQYCRKQYKNLPEHWKQKLVEYKENYSKSLTIR